MQVMRATSLTADAFANLASAKASPSTYQDGAINGAIIQIIKDLYRDGTVKVLAGLLSVHGRVCSWKTAKNRLDGTREFNLDEVATLLSSEQGYRVLCAIMDEAAKRPGYKPPDWWEVCAPLMDLADQERMCELVRRRTRKVIRKREDVVDALEQEIRRAETLAIHGSAQAREHLGALESLARAQDRVVATRGRVK
jgi:hypothetical protein